MTGAVWYDAGFGVPGRGPVVSGLVYGVFLVMVLIGFRDRLRRSRAVAANTEAVAA